MKQASFFSQFLCMVISKSKKVLSEERKINRVSNVGFESYYKKGPQLFTSSGAHQMQPPSPTQALGVNL